MRLSLLAVFLLTPQISHASEAVVAVDWAQPPVACVEEVVPSMPDRKCLDLSSLPDPYKELPTNIDATELAYWKSHKQPLFSCRAQEVMRREQLHPGTFTPGKIEIAWMQLFAVKNAPIKISAVYEASRKEKVPVQVLAGALYQESMYAELGVTVDGGNFSCGVGQVNIMEWCRWANAQRRSVKEKVSWPADGV